MRLACLILPVFLVCACATPTEPAPLAPTPPIFAAEAPGPGQTRIALLGCIDQEEPAPALQSYAASAPDISLWVGDNVYIDTQDEPEAIYQGYRDLSAQPGFAALRAQGIHLATWDDHDYGDNDEDRTYRLKDDGQRAFTEFWGEAGVPAEPKNGIYHARLIETEGKRLHVILLDVRWNRDVPDTGGDILGEAQWAWLAEQLAVDADLTLIVSGTQVLLPKEAGSETWDNYPGASERLFGMVRRSGREHVVLITGDQHYAEVARRRGLMDFDAIELQFAGVNQIEAPELNPWRVSAVNSGRNSMALVDIQWEDDAENLAHLLYRVFDTETGETESIYRVNFAELDLDLDMTERELFHARHSVELVLHHPELEIRYTRDGTLPTARSPLYRGPIALSDTTTITAAYFAPEGYRRSKDFSRTYTRARPVASVNAGTTQPGLSWGYWEGEFMAVPDFTALGEPLARGISEDLDVKTIERRDDHYAIRFTGFVTVPETGLYRVSTRSDDGSVVDIAGQRVVDNDGSHSPRVRSGFIALEAGSHPIEVGYFEDHSGVVLELRFERFSDDGSARPVDVTLAHRP